VGRGADVGRRRPGDVGDSGQWGRLCSFAVRTLLYGDICG
jgi:hypothetical protein